MNLVDIDIFLNKLEAAKDDDHLRDLFEEYSADYFTDLPEDPFSEEYKSQQLNLYKILARKEYAIENEITSFNIEEMSANPFPYCHQSFETVGDTLLAIGFLIKTMALPSTSKILEFGPGWGNTSIELARMGYAVTTIDIENNFTQLILSRARKLALKNIKALTGNFFDIDYLDESYDAILFFESFHHCADHNLLISKLSGALNPGGKIVFGAEPITKDFPIPWGLRMDGQSLWAIRKNGWLELGFNRTYFTKALRKSGFTIKYFDGTDGPWSRVAVAQRFEDSKVTMLASDERFHTQIGSHDDRSILGSSTPGYLVYGPYLPLDSGGYRATLDFSYSGEDFIPLKVEIVHGGGLQPIFALDISLGSPNAAVTLDFFLDLDVCDLEFRVIANMSEGLSFNSLVLVPIQ